MKRRLSLLGIIGDPITHSLSPAMQNANFGALKLPFAYLPFHVRPSALSSFLKDILTWKDFRGFNVTIPHKEAILRHMDRLSPEARAIGAVNTVVISRGLMTGYNTDASGYLRSLKDDAGFSPRGKKILILGAGGAARAVVYALSAAGAQDIAIANRTQSRAKKLAREFSRRFPKVAIHDVSFERTELQKLFPEIDLLVNTTSIGLKGTRFTSLPLKALRRSAVVSDLVYRPRLTPLLKDAKRRGLKVHEGLGMLLHQGALAAERWTKKMADLTMMKKALLDALKRT